MEGFSTFTQHMGKRPRFLVQMMCKLYAVKIGQKQQRKVIIPHFSVGANLQSAMHSSLTVAAQVYGTWKIQTVLNILLYPAGKYINIDPKLKYLPICNANGY